MLYFLATFHGLAQHIVTSPDFSSRVHDFLGQLGWSHQEIVDGFCRLQRHLQSPLTVEEHIVHDANYVELFGAFGIAKAFTKGGAEGQSYEETADIFERQFLDAVEFKTPEGRRMAAEKRAYTKDFLARLRAEL
jgi:HD superfamily phosphodiesterase